MRNHILILLIHFFYNTVYINYTLIQSLQFLITTKIAHSHTIEKFLSRGITVEYSIFFQSNRPILKFPNWKTVSN